MRLSPFALFSAGLFVLACGARSGSDEFLGFDGPVGIGGAGGTGGSGGLGSGGFGVGGTATGGVGSCCSPSTTGGCADSKIEACVCASDPFCCADDGVWDQTCVDGISARGCGQCGGSGGAAGTGGLWLGGGGTGAAGGGGFSTGGLGAGGLSTGGVGVGGLSTGGLGAGGLVTGGTGSDLDCCSVHNSAGCLDPDVTACVCEDDPFCCVATWDATCVRGAQERCGTRCMGSGGAMGVGGGLGSGGLGSGGSPAGGSGGISTGGLGGGPTGGGGTGGIDGRLEPCCTPHLGVGCNDPAIEMCVCAEDPYCCEYSWDSACVTGAELRCMGNCSEPSGECCEAHGGPGCVDQGIAACVCGYDPSCCSAGWHDTCPLLADYACGATCDFGSGGSSGSGGTGGDGTGAAGSGAATGTGGANPACDGLTGCAACTCENCSAEVDACSGDPGCVEISLCIVSYACQDSSCVLTQCGEVIDANGGVIGSSFLRAISLASCSNGSGCPCP